MQIQCVRHLVLQALLLTSIAFGAQSSTLGDVVLSNLTDSPQSTDYVRSYVWIANSFITDNQTWLLNSVTLSMGAAADSSGNFTVSIWSDNGSNSAPSTSLESLNGTDNPSTAGNYTYSAAGLGLSLNANTEYWLVASVPSGAGVYRWEYAGTAATSGPWIIPATNTVNYSYDSGGSFDDPIDGDPFQFAINATAVVASVPEITTAGIGSVLALVLGAIGLLERRRLKAA